MAVPPPLIAYPPVQRAVKQEILDEPPEVNNYEEENWKLQVEGLYYSLPINAILKLLITWLLALDAGQSKEQFRDGQEETLQDTEMVEDLGSEEEVKCHTQYQLFQLGA